VTYSCAVEEVGFPIIATSEVPVVARYESQPVEVPDGRTNTAP
jgi:hypothetical protein